ncbi:MAG: metal ABC transporter ATP-binding protein [Christensenellales bacterium]|jgi:zinc transport system ATP-binding protein
MDNYITFDNVRFCYGEVCAIKSVVFALQEKTLTALVGPNGGGKTTLIKLIAGLIKPDNGNIIRRDGMTVGYVPQIYRFDLSFPVTVKELVLMGTLCQKPRPFFRYGSLQNSAATDALKRVGLSGYALRGISQLSGGQLRRAVIARALASDADVIVLDEPDAGLDINAARELYAVLGALKSDKTVIVSSHDINAVLSIADNAIYVSRTAHVFSSPEKLKERLKGGLS